MLRKLPAREKLPGHFITFDEPMPLDSGSYLAPVTVAYQTYGTLNADKSNAIVICHALTGDQFVAEDHPVTGKPGWWGTLVGPGKPVDTDRFFVICSNIIGGCMGSSAPMTVNPASKREWGLDFPVITIGDMVRAQKMLVDSMGIEKLYAVIGGSVGGMQVLEWAARYPAQVARAMPIATAARHTAQNIAFHEVGRQAIMADPNWNEGDYYRKKSPERGLSVARMAAHITYLSEEALHRKFGRTLQDRDALSYAFDADFQIESYLRHQGRSFVDRFDANSYLYITRAADYFDLAARHEGQLSNVFKDSPVKFCIVSFTSDWLYPTSESLSIVKALSAGRADVSFTEIDSDKGHDAFLLEEPEFFDVVRGFIGTPTGAQDIPEHSIDRPDFAVIGGMTEGSKTLIDIGCGDGTLMTYLAARHNAKVCGLEISTHNVAACVNAGLFVIKGNADTDLAYYADDSFDVAILSQTLQAMRDPAETLKQLLRIGRKAVVSFPNFGHWRVRGDLLLNGRMPVSKSLPYSWHETPNIHFCTIKDFEATCRENGIQIEERVILDRNGAATSGLFGGYFDNLVGQQAVYRLSRKG